MSWDGSWGGEQSNWGSGDSWQGSADDTWDQGGGNVVPHAPTWPKADSGSDSWNQSGDGSDSWSNSTGESWGTPSNGGTPVKGTVVKPPEKRAAQQQDTSWNQQQAWKKPATESTWQNGGVAKPTMQAQMQIAQQKVEEMKKKAQDQEAEKTKKTAEFKPKSEKATRDVEMAEKLANQALEKGKKLLEDEKATLPALKVTVDSLEKQQAKLKEVVDAIMKDIAEGKQAGPLLKDCVQELQKAMVKANGVKNQVTITLGKLKPKATKAQLEADAKAKKEKEEAEKKAKEAKDSASFKPVLAKVTKDVAAVEAAVNAISKKADAVIGTAPDSEELEKVAADIEKAASEAFKKLNTTRTELNEKFKMVTAFTPELKKTAHASLAELQKKLVEFGKKASVYTSFKKELPKLAASREALSEVKAKLDGHDRALTNAIKLGDLPQLDKARLEAIDDQLGPIKKSIQEASSIIAQKVKNADQVSSLKFSEFKAKGEDMLKKIQAVYTKIKKERDVIMSAEFVVQATEKLEKAEEGWKSCQDAEMPFLTGVEVLEGEQNDTALKECAEAIAVTTAAINEVKNYTKSRLAECKEFEKELGDQMTAELTPFLAKITACETNIAKFKKEHAERKILSVMSSAFDAVEALEKKVSEVEKHGKHLSPDDVEDASVESILETIEKTKSSLTEASAKLTESKKVVKEKQWEAKADSKSEKISKLHSKLTAAQEKIDKSKSAIQFAEKVVKAKKAIKSGEEKVKEAEAEVAKVEKFEDSTFDAASVKEFSESCTNAMFVIRSAGQIIQPHVATAPAKAKEVLQGLLERKSEAQKTIEKLKADTKDAREEVLCNVYLADSEKNTKAVEEAAELMDAAEKPFILVGDLPLADSLEAIKKCEETAAAVKQALTDGIKFREQKSKEAKQFGEAASKKATEGFKEMSDRVKSVSTKLSTFEKDLKERTKSTKMTEAGAKVDEVETALKNTLQAAEPFTKEGGANMSEKDAEAPLKVYKESEKELTTSLSAAKAFLKARSGEQQGNKENLDTLKKLQDRLSKVQAELSIMKKATASHEQRALGTQMLTEAKEHVGGLDAAIQKAADACAPLLEKAGEEFLVDASFRTLVAALQAHMKEKELTVDALFKEVGKGKPVKEKAFVEYLAKLPEAISHDELSAFSDERRGAVFNCISSDGKAISAKNFTGMFQRSYTCIKPVTLTDRFAADGSETVCKVEPNSEVLLFGVPQEDEAGLLRSEGKVGDQEGWITISQKKGQTYLKLKTKFEAFHLLMDNAISDAATTVHQVSTSVCTKAKPGAGDEAPMKESRAEIAKLKEKVAESQKAMEELKKKVATAKRDYSAKEKSEMNAHVEIRNMKEAAAYLENPNAKLEALEVAVKAVDDACSPLTSLSGDELLGFTTPATTLAATEKANSVVTEKATDIREVCKEQLKAASEVTPPTGGTAEAKKQLKQMQNKIEEAVRKASKCLATARSNCSKIVGPKLEPLAAAIRKYAQEKKLSGEALFDSFKEEDKIPEAAFCKLVASLGDTSVSPDVAKLISQKIGKDGISKDAFLNYVVVYYKVLKSIAFTDVLVISKCKTLRKIEVGEVLEMLEEPSLDEASGVTRVRAKALTEPICEGWVTLCGNQGSSFLEKTKKP